MKFPTTDAHDADDFEPWYALYDGSLKDVLTKDSFDHPAKMARGVTEKIIDYGLARGYWKRGDLLFDPFGGVGTTLIIGTYRGMRCVGIELEPRFYRMFVGHDCGGYKRENDGSKEYSHTLCPFCLRIFKCADEEQLSQLLQEARRRGYSVRDGSVYAHRYVGTLDMHREKFKLIGRDEPLMIRGDTRTMRKLLSEAVDAGLLSPPYSEGLGHGSPSRSKLHVEKRIALSGSKYGYGNERGQISAMSEGEVDAALASPPYANSDVSKTHMTSRARSDPDDPHYRPSWQEKFSAGHDDTRVTYGKTDGQLSDLSEGSVDVAVGSPPYIDTHVADGDAVRMARAGKASKINEDDDGGGARYGDERGQIGRMSEGEIELAVTSPPYATSQADAGGTKGARGGDAKMRVKQNYVRPDTEGQIANLSHGTVELAVTSPPYSGKRDDGGVRHTTEPDGTGRQFQPGDYGDAHEQIDRMTQDTVDAALGSPPYVDSRQDTTRRNAGRVARELLQNRVEQGNSTYGESEGQIQAQREGDVDAAMSSPPYAGTRLSDGGGIAKESADHYSEGVNYGESRQQIGAMRDDGALPNTYWGSMRVVYSELLRVMKRGGYAAIVVKDFVRDKKRIRLCDDTRKLLMSVGWEYVETKRAMLVAEAAQATFASVLGDVTLDATMKRMDGSVRHIGGETKEARKLDPVKRKKRQSFFRNIQEKKLEKGDERIIDWEEIIFVRKAVG